MKRLYTSLATIMTIVWTGVAKTATDLSSRYGRKCLRSLQRSNQINACFVSGLRQRNMRVSNTLRRKARLSTTTTEQSGIDNTEAFRDQSEISDKFPRFFPDDYTLHRPDPSCLGMVTNLEQGQRIVSFGDVHGDLTALVNFLVTARVLEPPSSLGEVVRNPKWIGGKTICIQCGDILDRGDAELACLRLLSRLSKQAVENGGAIHVLYGNHESLNTAGLFQYAYPEGNSEFESMIGRSLDKALGNNRWRLQFAGNQASRWAAFEPGGLLSENVLGNMNVAMVVGRSVFVHAGLTATHLRDMGGVEGMNSDAREWVQKAAHKESNHAGNYESVEAVLKSARQRAKCISNSMPDCLGGGIGAPSPVWMRDYSQPSDRPPANANTAQHMIEEALSEVGQGATRMVMGHTPQNRINAALRGRAWRIDVGASLGVKGGKPEVLEIIHGGADNHGEFDEVHILTMDGERIRGSDRHLVEDGILFDYY